MALRGFSQRRSREFEHTRAIVYTTYKMNVMDSKNLPPMEKFWPLPTDVSNKVNDEEEGDRLYEKLQKFKRERLFK